MRQSKGTAARPFRAAGKKSAIISFLKACLVRALTLPGDKGRTASDACPPAGYGRLLPRKTFPLLPRRRYRRGGFCLISLISVLLLLCVPVFAATVPTVRTPQDLFSADAAGGLSAQFPEADVSQWLSRLREAIPEKLAGQITLRDPGDASALVGVPHFFFLLADSLTDGIPSAFGAFSAFCGLALLGCLASLVGEGISSSPLRQGLRILCAMSLSAAVYRLLQTSVSSAFATLSDLQTF